MSNFYIKNYLYYSSANITVPNAQTIILQLNNRFERRLAKNRCY